MKNGRGWRGNSRPAAGDSNFVRRYGIALFTAASVLGVRVALMPLLGTRPPYITFYLGIVIAAAFGGMGPGLLVMFIGVVFGFVVLPAGPVVIEQEAVRLGLFLLSGFGIVVVAEGMHRQRRRVQEQARELEQMVESLNNAKAAAEEASRAKSEFLANMSHEIRTPMTVFLAAIEHLRQIDQNPERLQLLQMAEQSAHRLRTLIDNILDFSRIEARRVELESLPFDLRSCVRNAIEMFTLASKEKNLALEMNVAPTAPEMVVGDSARLGQVLVNLIGNAVKFTHEGEIRVCVQPRDDLLEFSVIDTGIGIPEEKRELLFESFSQADSSFSRKFGGSGLGLAIVKGLLELMGGEISVQNRKEGGSIFSFTIPLKAAERQRTASDAAVLDRREETSAARILLVEDEPLVREMITRMLAKRGGKVESAENGREAVEKSDGRAFDLILMDLQMPEMNGLEATRAIRRREAEEGKRTCIIGFTAHARRETIEECLKSGMDQVLIKPVQTNHLFSAIDKCLSPEPNRFSLCGNTAEIHRQSALEPGWRKKAKP